MVLMKENKNPIDYYVYNYPQLTLGIKNGTKDSEAYKDIVLRGKMPEKLTLPIEVCGEEELIKVDTPIGETEVLYLPDRKEFEYFVKVLAYRNEDELIPKTTGAIYISGLNNWRKIEAHEKEFLKNHDKAEWDDEFDRFVNDKTNYQGTVLLISKGYYSTLDPKIAGYDEITWLELSKKIRIYHEISHQISRKLYLENKDAIRDEVIADCIGIIGALGYYDLDLHKKVLGIIDNEYIPGSRLENYIEKEKIEVAVSYTKQLIDKLEPICTNNHLNPFDLLLQIEKEHIK